MAIGKFIKILTSDRVLVGLSVLCGFLAWWLVYVIPHDEARREIIGCMGHDPSQSAYTRCKDKLSMQPR